jgi:hypothetical protein
MRESFLKALRGAVIVMGHGLIAAVLIAVASGVDHLILLLNDGKDMLVYNRFPLSYVFQTLDLALLAVFGVFGVIEAIKVMIE